MQETLARLVDAVVEVDPTDLADAALTEWVPALLRARARLDAALVAAVAVADARGVAAGQGCASTTAWLRAAGHVEPSAAGRLVATARALPHLPVTEAAFAAGEIDLAAAAAVASAARVVSVEAVREHLEGPLVDLARESDASQVRREVRRAAWTLAPEVVAAETERAFERRYLDVREGVFGSWVVDGRLDAEGAAAIRAALAPLTGPCGPEDGRTAGQRRADAFVEVARRALAGGVLPDSGGERPRVIVTIDAATLTSGVGAGELLSTGGLIAPDAVRRMSCDADLIRVILSGDGEVLDLGRTTRLPSAAQRRALVIRDRGCVFPGCGAPSARCEAHHLRWWRDGGRTDLPNLALVCGFHHRCVPECGWRLDRAQGGGWVATPPADRHRPHRRSAA
jgi:hypothetical protein